MAMVAPTARTVRPVRRLGRPPRPETRTEQIQGHAMGVVVEAGAGAEHLETARAIDALGDTVLDQIQTMLEQTADAAAAGNLRRVLGLTQAMRVALTNYKALDRAEEEHWERRAPIRVANARDDGRAIAGLCELEAVRL